ERAARRSTTQPDTRHGARSLARAEYARRLLHVLRLDPEHRAVSSVAGARGVDGGDVDLGVGQALQQRADRALAIVALDKEDRLRRLELELGALRGAAEGRGVFRNEIELRLAGTAGETGEREQVHAGGRERREQARRFAALIRHVHRKIIRFAY